MKRTSLAKSIYLAFFSRPRNERIVYRQIGQLCANSVVEFGVGAGLRSRRMIEALARHSKPSHISYVGIDLFEARSSDQPGMTLKRAHRLLAETGVQIRLIPGDPYSALARSANALTGTDLIVIGAGQDATSLRDAWFYLPRMMHEDSRLLVESPSDQGRFEQLTLEEVTQRAQLLTRNRKAAA